MQEEKENMVDIDTSGPGADVELPEEKLENEIEKAKFAISGC